MRQKDKQLLNDVIFCNPVCCIFASFAYSFCMDFLISADCKGEKLFSGQRNALNLSVYLEWRYPIHLAFFMFTFRARFLIPLPAYCLAMPKKPNYARIVPIIEFKCYQKKYIATIRGLTNQSLDFIGGIIF